MYNGFLVANRDAGFTSLLIPVLRMKEFWLFEGLIHSKQRIRMIILYVLTLCACFSLQRHTRKSASYPRKALTIRRDGWKLRLFPTRKSTIRKTRIVFIASLTMSPLFRKTEQVFRNRTIKKKTLDCLISPPPDDSASFPWPFLHILHVCDISWRSRQSAGNWPFERTLPKVIGSNRSLIFD